MKLISILVALSAMSVMLVGCPADDTEGTGDAVTTDGDGGDAVDDGGDMAGDDDDMGGDDAEDGDAAEGSEEGD